MAMGRPRKKDRHLPRRVYFENGRYWYKPKKPENPPPTWKHRIDLGTTLKEMRESLPKHLEAPTGPLDFMHQVFDRYVIEVLPTLASRTQEDYGKYLLNLRPVYDDAPPPDITAGHLFDYRAKRAQSSVTQANREMSCMSAVFRCAVGWHARKDNPLSGSRSRRRHDRLRSSRPESARP